MLAQTKWIHQHKPLLLPKSWSKSTANWWWICIRTALKKCAHPELLLPSCTTFKKSFHISVITELVVSLVHLSFYFQTWISWASNFISKGWRCYFIVLNRVEATQNFLLLPPTPCLSSSLSDPIPENPIEQENYPFFSLSILLLQACYLPQVNLAFSRVSLGSTWVQHNDRQLQGKIARDHVPVRGAFPLAKSCHDLQPPSLLPEHSVTHAQDTRAPGPGTHESGSCVSCSLSISSVK